MNIKPNVDLFEVKSSITTNQSFLRAFHTYFGLFWSPECYTMKKDGWLTVKLPFHTTMDGVLFFLDAIRDGDDVVARSLLKEQDMADPGMLRVENLRGGLKAILQFHTKMQRPVLVNMTDDELLAAVSKYIESLRNK